MYIPEREQCAVVSSDSHEFFFLLKNWLTDKVTSFSSSPSALQSFQPRKPAHQAHLSNPVENLNSGVKRSYHLTLSSYHS